MDPFVPNTTPKSATPAAPYSPQKSEIQSTILEMDEKINQILKYQRNAAHMETVRTIISVLVFIIFVVLPIIGTYYLYEQFKGSIDFSKIGQQYQELSSAVSELKSTSEQIQDIKQQIIPENLPKLPGLSK